MQRAAFVGALLFLSLSTLPASAQFRRERARVTTLTPDRADYPPESLAHFTGTGFAPAEPVTLVVRHADGTVHPGSAYDPWTVNADGLGGFTTPWVVCDCVGALLVATAVGDYSGLSAEATFTDNHECGTGVATVTPVGGSCVAFTPAVGMGPDNFEVQEGGTYMITISGVTECTGDTITVFIQSSESGNFCFNATGGMGTYSGMFTVPDPACNTMPISYKCGANAGCTHPDSFRASGPTSGCGGVHLRASNFDGSCNPTGTDTDCDSVGTCPQPVTMDFETDSCGDPLYMSHGLDLDTPGPECIFACPSISAGTGNGPGNAGKALFDSETTGGGDIDLQAPPPGQGNILILQNNNSSFFVQKTGVFGPDHFDHPNDDPDGGSLTFDFCAPAVMPLSVHLIDIDTPLPGQDATVILTDSGGFTRTFTVPGGWTTDGGVGLLDLTGGDQVGPNGALATVVTQAGYDGADVVQIVFVFGSSGALDNLSWCP